MSHTNEEAAGAIERLAAGRERISSEIRKVIVGQEAVVDELLVALFAGGHCLLVGVPGLAKTLLISSVAEVLDLAFSRIQFTPDLMPTDITGTEILEDEVGTGHRVFKFIKGPVFANVILADEINRTPPKTQAALLQAMQERQVTAGNETFDLDLPFFVLATQNPIEMEGTYPLPEAQLRPVHVQHSHGLPPAPSEETDIVRRTTGAEVPDAAGEGDERGRDPGSCQQLIRQGAGVGLRAWSTRCVWCGATRPDVRTPPTS